MKNTLKSVYMYIVEYSRFTEVEIMYRRVKEGCLYIQMLCIVSIQCF